MTIATSHGGKLPWLVLTALRNFGATGKYELDVNGLSVAPHAGLRYGSIDIDDYHRCW